MSAERDTSTAPPIEDCPPNTVQLFQYPRAPYAPSMSPFALKVETFLRLTGIPYKNDLNAHLSEQTKKIPWIRFNGEDVCDSTLILEHLTGACGVDLDKDLNTEQRAVATGFHRMVDEHLYWVLMYACCVEDEGFKIITQYYGDSDAVRGPIRDALKAQIYAQGMSRHTRENVYHFAESAMKALSDYLGKKDYMMGDGPCALDCTVFGMLAQFLWHVRDHWIGSIIPEKFPNLERFCVRMKEKAWPDWNSCITHDETVQAKE